MKPGPMVVALLLGCSSGSGRARAEDAEATIPALERTDLQFTQAAPYSDEANIRRHFGYTVPLPDYGITNEIFQLRAPASLSTNESWGLLVWISPGDDPTIPGDWDIELAKRHLLFVAPQHSGNSRHPLDRFRLALDATCNICRRYKVDRRRIYVGGFSGGARMASMLGVAYADVFTGTLCCCGVNFYKDIAAAAGQYYPGSFTPDPGALLLAKRNGRFVLLTGEHDENRDNTQRVSVSGFKREGFRNVLFLEIPAMKHSMPPAAAFGAALDFLTNISQSAGSAGSQL